MYDKLEVIEQDKRIFKATASVDIRDNQGDIIDIDDLEKSMLTYMDDVPAINYQHTNKVIGKVLNFGVTENAGKKELWIVAKIKKTHKLCEEAWNGIISGKYKGVSISGEFDERDANGYVTGTNPWEISLVEKPANPLAKILAVNTIAKSDTEIQKPFAGYTDFEDCLKQNQDKENPEAYCGAIQNAIEKYTDTNLNKENKPTNEPNGDNMAEEEKKEKVEEKPIETSTEQKTEEKPIETQKEEPTEPTEPVEKEENTDKLQVLIDAIMASNAKQDKILELLSAKPSEPVNQESNSEINKSEKVIVKSQTPIPSEINPTEPIKELNKAVEIAKGNLGFDILNEVKEIKKR